MQIIEIILLIVVIVLLLTGQSTNIKTKRKPKMIVDSCGLIDGRIIELMRSGFISSEVVIPEFIIKELQILADGSDSHKRERARFGLDVVSELQDIKNVTISIDKSFAGERTPTDDRLLKLAKKLKASIYTIDFNLNKVASIQGITVLNVNQLAQQLRPEAIPGERRKIKILQKGSNQSQGVGYLDDGTMVVVDRASKLIGKTVEIEVIRSFQTVAGKMFFAQLTNSKQ